ncbi:hypothetical protein GpartN1_g7552.t1 [Galdieria partita]|uniref:peptidylprolyl isomerase n=1 Tax=Galdieria partita TaxID=83374 RepID=A0A9C7UUA0_9RHOD|nr:hypothetical protein GpartN1_g7552.t1 [Galdieria partita]
MWSFQSFPMLHVCVPCCICQKTTNIPKQLLRFQSSRFYPRKVSLWRPERGHSFGQLTRTVICSNVQTENVPDLEEQEYEILEEKQLPGSQLCVHVQVNGRQTLRFFENQLSEYSKTALIPGFRKGKVPRPVLINQVGSKVASVACRELIHETVKKVLTQEKRYTPLSKATLSEKEEDILKTFEPGKTLSFQFTFEVYPQVNFKMDYKGLQLKVPREEFQSTMVENTLLELLERNANWVPVSDETIVGQSHKVVVDIKAWYANSDGTKGASLSHLVSESEAEVDMERGNYMEGFKEGLIGARVGETVSIALKFPDNAKRQDLRGISAIFDITIKELKRKELPVLDDSLVKSQTQYSSVQELREAVTKQLEVEIQKLNDRQFERVLEDSLAEIVEVEVPQQVAEEHSQRKFANLLKEMKEQGVDEATVNKSLSQETYQKYKEETWTVTLKELKVWFGLEEIAKREHLEPNEEEIAHKLNQVKAEMNEKEMDWEAVKDRIKTDLEHSKTIEFLKDNAQIEYISNENL